MAACGSLQHIFENPLTDNPTLLESLSSWNQIKPVEQSSFTEIFEELHFKETPHPQSSSPSSSPSPSSPSSSTSSFPISPLSSTSLIDLIPENGAGKISKNNDGLQDNDESNRISRPSVLETTFSSTPKIKYSSSCHSRSDSFSLMNSESLHLCTEGLGFESSDDVEDLKSEMTKGNWQSQEEKTNVNAPKHTPLTENLHREFKRSRTFGGAFPPPISCIGKSGKPWVCFKSYRQDGRFVLKEVRIPTQEFLHAYREDGRLKLHFVQPNDEILEEEEFPEEEEDEVEDTEGEEDEEGINDDVEGKQERLAHIVCCRNEGTLQ